MFDMICGSGNSGEWYGCGRFGWWMCSIMIDVVMSRYVVFYV